MASCSPPPPPSCPNPQQKYEVFLSFRGDDTRSTVTSHLYHALFRENIETFIDDERVERGAERLKIIEESKISVVIFSKGYASSPWCLDELVQILESKRRIGQIVVPIFYQVDPSDVWRFAEEFPKHKEHFKVERWRVALRQVANISGWHLQGHELKLVDDIVRDISKKLWKGSLCKPKYDVYLNFRDDDTCSNFANDLLAALKWKQIKTLMKNDIFQNFRGDNIRINFTSLIHAALDRENVKTFTKDDVFQNFRGDSTHSNFISHPHAALDREKIKTFINYTVEGGAEISQTLLKRIEESKISVVILSKDYASSPWCLDELVKILECRRTNEQIVIPIYYHVYRSDVKYQTGCFAEAFAKHEVKFKDGVDKVKRWRAALEEVANLAGWPSQGPESVLVDEITREILKKLRKGSLGRSAFLNDITGLIANLVIVSSELWGGRIRYLKQNGQDSIECNGGKQDCFSGLPDDILFSILSRLSFREAVKTSILSTRWRYLYACMPNLDFSSLTMFGLPEEDHVCPRYMQKFVKLVNQFIQLYPGQNIFSFRFAFCFGREFAVDDIERWISSAIRMGVEELDINFRCKQYLPCIFYKYNYSELYTFSCQLLSEAKKLKHLHLFGCILRPSFNFKINSLKSLDLDDVPLAGREVEEILSCCSNLERLRMRKCIVPTTLYIHGPSLRLKFLTISICFGLEAIDLCAINLTRFECFSNELIKFSFSGVPNLERVFLHMNRKTGMPYIFNELPKYLPQLKTLLVRTSGEQVKYLPARITLFSNLRNFELIFTTAVRIELLKNTCILSACPLLQKFCLVTTSLSCTNDIETEEPPPCHHTQLEEVEFGGFGGSKNELNIALYFLRSAVALKRMFISRNCRIYMGSGNWEYQWRDAWNDKEREMIHRHLQGKALCGSAECNGGKEDYLDGGATSDWPYRL